MSQPPPDARKCAVCGKPQSRNFKPFCSKRCADVDLGRWFGERYSVPSTEPPDVLDTDEDS